MKANKADHYAYRVVWSEEDQEHVGLCAEFPSLSWLSCSPESALRGIRRVVRREASSWDESIENDIKEIEQLLPDR